MPSGTVKWFDDEKGYGFIKPASGKGRDVFVHASAMPAGTLREGERVEYDEEMSAKGVRAVNVRPVE